MKHQIKIYKKNLLLLFLFIPILLTSFCVSAQDLIERTASGANHSVYTSMPNRLASMIRQKHETGTFLTKEIFSFSQNLDDTQTTQSVVSGAIQMRINKDQLAVLLTDRPETVTLLIPVASGRNISLELAASQVVADDFKVSTSSGDTIDRGSFTTELYYRGIIKGDESSIAAITIAENYVMGFFSDKDGNYVVGSAKDRSGAYTADCVVYNDKKLRVKNTFTCGAEELENNVKDPQYNTEDINQIKPFGQIAPVNSKLWEEGAALPPPVSVYIECDYQMYKDNNSNWAQVESYTKNLFNAVATLYQNEGITIYIGWIFIWNSQDPYPTDDRLKILQSFTAAMTEFSIAKKFPLAHLLSTNKKNLGGLSYTYGLCQDYGDNTGPTGYTNINNGFIPIIYPEKMVMPSYTWNTYALTHELGHNLGSKHTHWCKWPGGPIDLCSDPGGETYWVNGQEIACPSATPVANNNGTIMSYCHLNGSINFSLGFGPLPGDAIRDWYYYHTKCMAEKQCPQGPDRFLNTDLKTIFKLNYIISKNVHILFEAENNITFTGGEGSTFEVSSQGAATFLTGNLINLKPGFSVINGGRFKAMVKKDCPYVIIAVPIPAKSPDETEKTLLAKTIKPTNIKSEVTVYPNPSSGQFTFEYTLEADELVSLSIIDKLGKKVKQLLNKTRQKPGIHRLQFNAAELNDDVYIYLFETSHKKSSGKLIKTR